MAVGAIVGVGSAVGVGATGTRVGVGVAVQARTSKSAATPARCLPVLQVPVIVICTVNCSLQCAAVY